MAHTNWSDLDEENVVVFQKLTIHARMMFDACGDEGVRKHCFGDLLSNLLPKRLFRTPAPFPMSSKE